MRLFIQEWDLPQEVSPGSHERTLALANERIRLAGVYFWKWGVGFGFVSGLFIGAMLARVFSG